MSRATPRFDAVIASPVGPLGLAQEGDTLTRVAFLTRRHRTRAPGSPLLRETAAQLARYFADPDWRFDLPLADEGTPFQRRTWAALRTIPRGQPLSYGALAAQLDSGPRAVGGACRANPLVIVTPCHRVVAAHGGLGGFAGATTGHPVQTKRWLLEHEAQV